MIKISLVRLQKSPAITGIYSGKCGIISEKGLFAYAFSGRDITGKSVEDMVYRSTEKYYFRIG